MSQRASIPLLADRPDIDSFYHLSGCNLPGRRVRARLVISAFDASRDMTGPVVYYDSGVIHAALGNRMNLAYVHKLLVAADQQPDAYLKVRGRHADREVRFMAEAGLVEATLGDGKEQSFTTINRVTDVGHAFLRAFKDPPIPTAPARIKGMAGEWNLNP